MPRRNTIRADDLDFEIHVDPSCLSDPMDDNENKAPEEPKVEVETASNQETEPIKDLDTDIETADHDDSTAEAKVESTTEATEEDKSTVTPEETEEQDELDQESAVPEAEAKPEPASESEEEPSDSESEIEAEEEAEAQVDLQEDADEPIEQPQTEADEPASEAEVDTPAPAPSLDDTDDKDDEEPTPVDDVTAAEDTPAEAPIEDTPPADNSTEDISVEDTTTEDLDDDEPVEEDKAKSAEAEVEESIVDNEERQFSETESDVSGSRRVSSGSSGSSYSEGRHSTRSEAIQEVARDIASQIDNHEKRESLNSYSGADDDSYVSHARTVSARQSGAHMARSVKSGVDEAGENSSHHEHEDDVFSDRSPRSSVGSVSEGDHRKAQDAMSRMTRSPRVSGISGISGFSEYDREEEDFIPTIRGNPRPIFRSPSSVKAMQMSSPPGSTVGGSPRSGRRAPLPSSSRISSPRFSEQYSPKRTPPRFKRSTPPLVLLHVTLLPLRWPWGEVLENADPEELSKECKTIKDAWRTLQDRMGDTTVERGILLPHPQNDYEVLEERLLEALELPMRRRARILECGHYLGPSNMMTIEDSESESDEDEEEDDEEESEKRRESRRQSQPTHWCKTCKSDIHYESLGQGKIFRVKVYASNGLIRGGAWEACWKEMERVDVEIEPLVDAVSQHELVQLEADQERDLAMREAEEEERYVRLEEERREFESRERGRVSRRRGDSHGPIEDLTMNEGESHHDASQHAESVHDKSTYDQSHHEDGDVTKDSIKEPADDAEQSRSFEDLEKDIDEHLQEERERSLAEEGSARAPSPEASHIDEPSVSPEDPADSKHDEAEYERRDNERMREIYGDAPPASEKHHEQHYAGHSQPQYAPTEDRQKAMKSASLPELLAESARVVMQDKKNILIGLLSILIVLLAIRGGPGSQQSPDNFQFIRNAEAPTVTVTQAMGLETVGAVQDVAASVAAVIEEESSVESDLPEESIVVEDTVAEEGSTEEEPAKSIVDSSSPGTDGGAIPSLEAPSCSERIVRIVETVTAVETATVYASEMPSKETQVAEAIKDEKIDEEQPNEEQAQEEQAQESVAPEAEGVVVDSEASLEQEASMEEAPSEETTVVSEDAEPFEEVNEEEEPAQETVLPADNSFSDFEDETSSESAIPEASESDEEGPEKAAETLEEDEEEL
ncbi:hypothetical protein ACLX1H_006125 [Fusarium chlamydosporum]